MACREPSDEKSPLAAPPKLKKTAFQTSDEVISTVITENFSGRQSSYFDKDNNNRNHVKTGETPLHVAIRYDKTKCVEKLVLLGDMVNSRDCIGNKPIHTAAIYGKDLYIKLLLQKKQDFVHEINNRDETPLHLAVRYGHSKCVELLIKSGAALQTADNIGNTPIHTAIQYKQTDCLQLLLENGCSVFVLNRTNDTPIAAAKDLHDESLISMLQNYQYQV